MALLRYLLTLPRLAFGHFVAHVAVLIVWTGTAIVALGWFVEDIARFWLDIQDDQDTYDFHYGGNNDDEDDGA